MNVYEALLQHESACDWKVLAPHLRPVLSELTDLDPDSLPIRFGLPAHVRFVAGCVRDGCIYISNPDPDEDEWIAHHITTIFHEIGHYAWNPIVESAFAWIEDVRSILDECWSRIKSLRSPFGTPIEQARITLHSAAAAYQALSEGQAQIFTAWSSKLLADLHPGDGNILDILDEGWVDFVTLDCHSPLLTLWLSQHEADIEQIGRIARSSPRKLASALRGAYRKGEPAWKTSAEALIHILEERWEIEPIKYGIGSQDAEDQWLLMKEQHAGLSLIMREDAEGVLRNTIASIADYFGLKQ